MKIKLSNERKTNVEFLTEIMEFSRNGAMMQMFIMNALTKAADEVADMPIEELRKAFGEVSFVNPDAWHATAVELKAEMIKHIR